MFISFEDAVEWLAQGEVVALPTETVYGLAGSIDSEAALKKIFSLKRRPFFDPLIVHVESTAQAQLLAADWNWGAELLAQTYWPGPLTLVLKKKPRVSGLITSGLETVGLRCPHHALALALIKKVGPLAAPSANLFGQVSPTQAQHVWDEFGGVVPVLDGGPCQVGVESTIVGLELLEDGSLQVEVLRPGLVSREKINNTLTKSGKHFSWRSSTQALTAPGQMKHHYMPALPLVVLENEMPWSRLREKAFELLAQLPDEVEGVRLRKPQTLNSALELKISETPDLAARELYQVLRDSAARPVDWLWLVWPLHRREGDWLPIWDRLKKAASVLIANSSELS